MMFKALSILMLVKGVSAMQVKVESYECKEKAMTVTFNKICNQEDTCYLGEYAELEGYGKSLTRITKHATFIEE